MISTILKNALYVYATWFDRNSKPDCKIPEALITNPRIFEKEEFCMSCTCKFSCRYDVPPSSLKLD